MPKPPPVPECDTQVLSTHSDGVTVLCLSHDATLIEDTDVVSAQGVMEAYLRHRIAVLRATWPPPVTRTITT